MTRLFIGTFAACIAAVVLVSAVSKSADEANEPKITSQPVQTERAVALDSSNISSVERAKLEQTWIQQKIERKLRESRSDKSSASLNLDRDLREIERSYQAEAEKSMDDLKWQTIQNRR